MKIKLILCLMTLPLFASDTPFTDNVKLKLEGAVNLEGADKFLSKKIETDSTVTHKLEGLEKFSRQLKTDFTLTHKHKIEVPSSTVTKLAGLGFSLLGATTIGGGILFNDDHESFKPCAYTGMALIGVGIGLWTIDYLINEWNKEGTDNETTEEDNNLSDDNNPSELVTDNISP